MTLVMPILAACHLFVCVSAGAGLSLSPFVYGAFTFPATAPQLGPLPRLRKAFFEDPVLQSPRYDRPREQTLGRGHT